MWFIQLLFYALPSMLLIYVFVMYLFGAISNNKIKFARVTKVVGFFIAWFITGITALFMSGSKTVLSAQQEVFPAAAIGVIIALLIMILAGRRTSTS